MPKVPSHDQQLAEYRRILVEMDSVRAQANHSDRWNRLVNQMQQLHLQLRATPEGRAGISALIDDDCVTVREWSATNTLEWEPERARAALEALAADLDGHASFNAKMTLREFDAGRLRTDWLP